MPRIVMLAIPKSRGSRRSACRGRPGAGSGVAQRRRQARVHGEVTVQLARGAEPRGDALPAGAAQSPPQRGVSEQLLGLTGELLGRAEQESGHAVVDERAVALDVRGEDGAAEG